MTLLTSKLFSNVFGLPAEPVWQATGISIDSRTVKPGELYVALKGENFDGHDFIESALKNGAVRALSQAPTSNPLCIEVPDTLQALRMIAAEVRKQFSGTVVGLTGSVGKTSTKETIKTLLQDQVSVYANSGGLNNHIGLPLSLARLPADAAYGVFEMGMNHTGEISDLTNLLRPHHALITTVEAAHTEFFDSVDDIAAAKAEIFEGICADGIAILNRDNQYYAFLKEAALKQGAARILSFGEHPESDLRLVDFTLYENCSQATIQTPKGLLTFTLNAPGRHWITIAMTALAVVSVLELDLTRAAATLSNMQPLKGRGERTEVPFQDGIITVIDESYNASPAATKAALEMLKITRENQEFHNDTGRTLFIFADMRELGQSSRDHHLGLKDLVVDAADLVFMTGTETHELFDILPDNIKGQWAASSGDLISPILQTIRPGDTLLIKGSLSMNMGQIVTHLCSADLSQPSHLTSDIKRKNNAL